MGKGLVSMSEQFKGLPMESLIGGPLQAACKANLMLAKTTADYINAVGFEPAAADGTPGAVRNVDFQFERPNQGADGKIVMEEVHVRVPMLAIVPIPNLQVDTVDVVFDMEVKSSTSDSESSDTEASLDAHAKVGWGPFSCDVQIHGKTSSHKEHSRTSDNSAKYHVEVHASNAGTPEGLSRVLDMMAAAAAPRKVVTKTLGADGEVDPNCTPVVNPQNSRSIPPTT